MSDISFQNREIQPLFSTSDGYENPGITKWSEDILEELKHYFSNDISDFLIETISYLFHHNEMSSKTKGTHIELLLDYLKNKTDIEIINCSSFEILSYLFEDRTMKDIFKSSKAYKNFFFKHSETEIEIIDTLKKYSYPISKELNKKRKTCYRTKYENLNDIILSYSLSQYLKDIDIVKEIVEEYFDKLKTKFRDIINKESDIEIASLFIDYMEFLLQSQIDPF